MFLAVRFRLNALGNGASTHPSSGRPEAPLDETTIHLSWLEAPTPQRRRISSSPAVIRKACSRQTKALRSSWKSGSSVTNSTSYRVATTGGNGMRGSTIYSWPLSNIWARNIDRKVRTPFSTFPSTHFSAIIDCARQPPPQRAHELRAPWTPVGFCFWANRPESAKQGAQGLPAAQFSNPK